MNADTSGNPVDPALPAHAALQAPWRMQYLESITSDDAANAAATGASSAGCFLQNYWLAPPHDEANHVVARTAHGMILLNAYPYSNGHLLVALGEGRPRLLDYTPRQRAQLWTLVDAAADLCEVALQPQGLNIGINQGKAAGAGVPQHLHVHVIPRWGGDTSFMTTVGRVRVIPASLEVMAKRYRAAWGVIDSRWTDLLS